MAVSPAGSPRHSVPNVVDDEKLARELAAQENDRAPNLVEQPGERVGAAAARGIAAQPKAGPVEDRAGQEGFIDEAAVRAWAWVWHATAGIDQFVVDYPVAALVMAVVAAIFGISQILPSFLAALVTGIPLCLFSFRVYQAANARWPEFSQALAAAGGDQRAIAARQQANQRGQMAGAPQLQGVRNGLYQVPGGLSLLG